MPVNVDPNSFHVDWDRTFEALALIIVLAFVVERALAMLFESRPWIERWDKPGLKELIAVAVSVAVCWFWKFDAISMFVLTTDRVQIPGFILTGAVIAGGSKASIKLFHDVLGAKSSTYDVRHVIRAEKAAKTAESEAAKATPNMTTEQLGVVEKKTSKAEADATQAAAVAGTESAAASAERAREANKEVADLVRRRAEKKP